MKILILKYTLICILFLAISPLHNTFAQCGTVESTDEEMQRLPWFGNNQYLYDFMDSLERVSLTRQNERSISCDTDDIVTIPIQFWVYRESTTETANFHNADLLQEMMDNLNFHYQNSGMNVRFVMLPLEVIFDSVAVDIESTTEADELNLRNRHPLAINVHIVRFIEGAGGTYYPPQFRKSRDFIFIRRDAYTGAGTYILSHEIGHYFSLKHTHRNSSEGKCKQEAVSRTRTYPWYCVTTLKFGKICEKSGDGLCDTPADPQLNEPSTATNVNATTCSYIGNATDEWGDRYVPDTRNLMSYNLHRDCSNRFSPMQVAVMKHDINQEPIGRTYIRWTNDNFLNTDHYEPDNSAEVARPIALGETQCHSFSTVQSFVDERDWLSIDISQGILDRYYMDINSDDNVSSFVEDVKVYRTDASGNIGAEVSITKHIRLDGDLDFEIRCTDVVGTQRLLIEVIRIPNQEGVYTIDIKNNIENDFEIKNDKKLACIGDELKIGYSANSTLISSDFNIKWTAQNITLSNYTGNTTSITGFNPNSSGLTYSISAKITSNNPYYCSTTLTKTFEGTEATFPDFEIVEDIAACYLSSIGGKIVPAIGTYSTEPSYPVQWSVNYGILSPASGLSRSVDVLPISEGYFTLTATLENECGNTTSVSKDFYAEDCPQVFLRLSASPNPTSNTLTIKIEDDAINGNYQVIINDQLATTKYQNTTSIKEFQIDVSNYRDGVYFLRVYGENYSESLKFIVNHTN